MLNSIFSLHFHPYSLVILFTSLISFGLILYVMSKRYSAPIIFWLIFILLICSFDQITQFFIFNSYLQIGFKFWNLWNLFGIVICPPIYLAFIIVLTDEDWLLHKVLYWVASYIPPLIFLFLCWNTNVIVNLDINNSLYSIWGYFAQATPIGYFSLFVYYLLYYFISFIIMARLYSTTSNFNRKQSIIIINFAIWISILGCVICYAVFPYLFGITTPPAGNILFVISSLIITYAITKYGGTVFSSASVMSTVFDAVNEAVICINKYNSIEFINNGGLKLLGYSRKEILNKNIINIFFNIKDFVNVQEKAIIPLHTTDYTEIDSVSVINSKGEKLLTTLSATKITDEDNTIIGYILIFTDVTKLREYYSKLEEKIHEVQDKNNSLEKLEDELEKDKKTIETKVQIRTEALNEERARLLSSIDNLSFGFIMTDRVKNVLIINSSVQAIWGNERLMPENTLSELQKNIKDFDILKAIDECIQKNEKYTKKDMKLKDKYVSIYISPIPLLTKNKIDIIGAVILLEDETEAKIMERSREEFFAIASHELRTPLTAIKGYISIIQEYYTNEIKSEELIKMLEGIGHSSQRLIEIVNEFLDTSKLEQGKVDMIKERIDINALVIDAINECTPLSNEKNLKIHFTPFIPSQVAFVDKDRLKQVLINLIGNGIKYTDMGSISVSIKKINDNFVKIFIQDTGKGISEESKKLLFRKFQQASENIYTREGNGTGLGLYISRLIMDRMGGSVDLVKSETNKGSVFSITVPLLLTITNEHPLISSQYAQ